LGQPRANITSQRATTPPTGVVEMIHMYICIHYIFCQRLRTYTIKGVLVRSKYIDLV